MKILLATLTAFTLKAIEALAAPDAARTGIHWFCGVPGSGCKPRSIDFESRPFAARQDNNGSGFCGVPGEVCTTLEHSAKAVRDALADHWAHYDTPKTGASALCNAPGGRCDIAREAIGNVSETAETAYHDLLARKADPKKHRILYLGGATTWFCGVPGAGCKKRRSETAISKRSDELAANAASVLNDVDPEFLKVECAKAGNECHSLLSAHAAFHQAKRELEAVQGLTDPEAKQTYCAIYSCDEDTEEYFRHLHSGSSEAQQIRDDCFAETGECTLAQRSLDALERSLNNAIAQIA